VTGLETPASEYIVVDVLDQVAAKVGGIKRRRPLLGSPAAPGGAVMSRRLGRRRVPLSLWGEDR